MISRNKGFITFLLVLNLFGCGKAPVLKVTGFEAYVAAFESAWIQADPNGARKVDDLVITFGQLENPDERGVCELMGDSVTPKITINQTSWQKIPESEREELLFHEMGHCVLKRRHESGILTNGTPSSIMNPYSIEARTYERNYSVYMKELFSKQGSVESL